MPTIRLSVRELVEFLLRTGSIDSRFTGFDRANEGARIHRRLQKAAGEGYAAEVFLTAERTMEGIGFTIEGRADGIFTDEDGTVVIDEIKTTAAPTDAITENMNPCHWAQGMVYGAICAEQRELETLDVRLTYYQIDTDEIIRYTRHFSAAELDAFLNDLLRQYLPWARRQLDWVEARDRSLGALQFPFPAYRPGQRALAGEVYRACAAVKAEQKGGTRLFCQAPTGIGKTMSALFPALKAMGEGKGEKIFYLTARNTTQAAAEDALARLRAADPALSLRSVTLTAKEKACLCKDAEGRPACLPEACPYANGYYERLKDALADLLDSTVPYDRAALTETARNTTQAAAEDALARLRAADPALSLRSVTLTAKEKACLCKDAEGRPACLPEACPYANGYYERLKDALADLLDSTVPYDRAALTETARRHRVCPFELGLDLSEWCDVVIGDYNYLFDPTVHLRRFFDAAGDYIFLIDEAHNLPDRARAMYSARFCKSSLTDARRAIGKGKSALKTALTKADRGFLEARRAVTKLAPRRGSAPTEPPTEDLTQQTSLLDTEPAEAAFPLPEPLLAQDGTVFLQELPKELLRLLFSLQAPLQDWLEADPEADAHAQLLELYFAVQDITRAAERYDAHFVTQLTARGSELEWELLCLDPAPFVDASLAAGRAAALFSATLTPPGYYRSVLGCPDARAVALESPFPPEHLGLYCLPRISTRYRDREASVQAVSDALAALARAKVGNYLAFFPSYAYLRQVHEDFTARYPDIGTLAQESGLDDAARAAFLEQFGPSPAKTLLGFGVMGGIFGEGVDLVGDRLIGCAIVGVGLPQVNPRQEILRRYYDEAGGTGFDYAYRFPGMNKVLQAAGRVIRTQEDRGVVLLLDDRFARAEYTRLFPRHWHQLQYLRSTTELEQQLAAFWALNQ